MHLLRKLWQIVLMSFIAGWRAAATTNSFVGNSSMLQIIALNTHLKRASDIMSSDFQSRLTFNASGRSSEGVSAAFSACFSNSGNWSQAENAAMNSFQALFRQQSKKQGYLENALRTRAALAKFIAHPNASAFGHHKFATAVRAHDVLSATTRSVANPHQTGKTALAQIATSASAPFPSVAFVAATSPSERFSQLHVWSLKSALMRGLAERVIFVGFAETPPVSQHWNAVKHFVHYVPRSDILPGLRGQQDQLAPAAALSQNAGVWMRADHLIMLPIQGILSNLTRSAPATSPRRTFLSSRAEKYSDVDSSFLAALPGDNTTQHWMDIMLKHAVGNCTATLCQPEASLAAAVARNANSSASLPRATLHFPSGAPERVRKSLFFAGKHVSASVQDALNDAFAVAVPATAEWRRWSAARSDATILKGNTGLDLAVRHLLHTEPAEAYWHAAMQAVVELTAGGGERSEEAPAAAA